MDTPREEYGAALVEQLREQVSNLMAATQLLTPAIREQPDRRYDQYIAILNQSLYRLLRMMNHIECAQRLECGAPELSFRPVVLDLAGLCRELSAQIGPLAELAGVSFRYETDPASLLMTGDMSLLQQMLLNLISNAIRAAGEGGEIGLRLSGGQARAILTVWDSGTAGDFPGEVPPSGEENLLKRRDGLGLGVLLARQIATLHGGALVFERREERGVRAVVSLPIGTPSCSDTLHTPQMGFDATGGFSWVLVELSGVLPYRAFFPEDVE